MNNVEKMQTSEPFDTLTVETEDILTFPGGLLGFEEFKRYVIVEEEACAPFKWLISADEPGLGFPIVPIERVYPTYKRSILQEVLRKEQRRDREHLLTYVIVTLENPLERSTVNLKGPLVVDPYRRVGRQLVLTSGDYPTDYPIIREQGVGSKE